MIDSAEISKSSVAFESLVTLLFQRCAVKDAVIVRERITTAAQLRMLDEGEILEGYLDGVHGYSAKAECTRSYEHGWASGMMESGRMPVDDAALKLRTDFQRLRR